jgi:hypothetical protein
VAQRLKLATNFGVVLALVTQCLDNGIKQLGSPHKERLTIGERYLCKLSMDL